jgi:hypothetical protein
MMENNMKNKTIMGSISRVIPSVPNRAILKVTLAFLNSSLCNSIVIGLETVMY